MELQLSEKPRNPVIIEGFPGYGLVGTIATEFLISHLSARQIGRVKVDEVAPVVAVHDNKAVDPIGIFYDRKNNIIIMHALTSVAGLEWKLADEIVKLADGLKAKEIISIEGVGNPNDTDPEVNAFYIGDNKKLAGTGIKKLSEGIIMGVTGALLLKEGIKHSCIFAETHSQLPDSRAAAKIIEVLDKYLRLKIDFKPLLKQAKEFEDKLRDVLAKTQEAQVSQEKKRQTYFG
ncbi:MAG: PAC2 family protein [Nanoarchaeota archaeon]